MSRTSTASSSPPSPSGVPARAEDVRATLERLGVRPTRAMGQSFLTDPFVADAEAALAEWSPGQRVVEVGGGLGILTEALLRRGVSPLTVVERDPRLARFLRTTFGDRVTVETADALEMPAPRAECVIGNLPYSVATPILIRLFRLRIPRVVFLVQREVAERLAAGPGTKAYGRLSILARCFGSVELFRVVPPEAFSPAPEVESRLGVHVAAPGALPVGSVEALEQVVRVLFSSRRKQLGNLLPRAFPNRDAAARAAEAADWPSGWEQLRPENLPPEAYFRLVRVLESAPHRARTANG